MLRERYFHETIAMKKRREDWMNRSLGSISVRPESKNLRSNQSRISHNKAHSVSNLSRLSLSQDGFRLRRKDSLDNIAESLAQIETKFA